MSRVFWMSWAVTAALFVSEGRSQAQQLSVASASSDRFGLVTAGPRLEMEQVPRPRVTADTPNDEWRALNDFINQLPINEARRRLTSNPRLRVAEALVGAALIGLTRSSALTYAGAQAIRLSGSGMEPKGFSIEPSTGGGGFVIKLRKQL